MTLHRIIKSSMLEKELVYSASRSDGPGGQNVNKVNSKVTLRFDVKNSQVLTEDEKSIVFKRLGSRLSKERILILTAQESRSQMKNKEAVMLKLEKILAKAFEKKKVRKATKPSKNAVQDRIKKKKQVGEKKKWRQRPE